MATGKSNMKNETRNKKKTKTLLAAFSKFFDSISSSPEISNEQGDIKQVCCFSYFEKRDLFYITLLMNVLHPNIILHKKYSTN